MFLTSAPVTESKVRDHDQSPVVRRIMMRRRLAMVFPPHADSGDYLLPSFEC